MNSASKKIGFPKNMTSIFNRTKSSRVAPAAKPPAFPDLTSQNISASLNKMSKYMKRLHKIPKAGSVQL